MTTTGEGYIFRPLPDNLRMKMKTQIGGSVEGMDYDVLFGDNSSVSISRNLEENEVVSNETPDQDVVLNDVTRNDLTINITLRQLTPIAKEILFQSKKILEMQASGNDVVKTFANVPAKLPVGGAFYKLGKVNVTAVSVTGGASDTPYVENVNYVLDTQTGRLQILSHPDGVVSGNGPVEVNVTFDHPALEIETYGAASQTSIIGSFWFRQNNKWGPSYYGEVPKVQWRVEGDMPVGQDGTDFGEIQIVGKVLADPTQPAAFRKGRFAEIKPTA